ncbi:MAG: NAD(P)H-dependent oxidoreductase [Streptococcaceae bacterium]|jgi:NAD(P)H-dependent FMN reductase|nr:NAD(P)H-dependent oxidoreductase [Streptococcaceae bacterium]
MNFVGIVGTNASFSYNRKLLWYMKKHFGAEAAIEIHEIVDIPLFSEDIKEIPVSVRELARAIEASDGVIFSTPEYDHSITAALKSLIEWLSWGDLHPLTNTPVMIVGVSLGNMGTIFAQENLRQILSSPGLDAFVLPGNQFLLGRAAEVFDETGALTEARTIGWLEHCFASFQAYTQTLKPLRGAGEDRTSSENKPLAAQKVLEAGDDWKILDIDLLPKTESDADTGASQKEDETDADTGASKHEEPKVATPSADANVIDSGEGWWIEAINLIDAVSVDSTTGASKSTHGKVAEASEQPDSSTGASKH